MLVVKFFDSNDWAHSVVLNNAGIEYRGFSRCIVAVNRTAKYSMSHSMLSVSMETAVLHAMYSAAKLMGLTHEAY